MKINHTRWCLMFRFFGLLGFVFLILPLSLALPAWERLSPPGSYEPLSSLSLNSSEPASFFLGTTQKVFLQNADAEKILLWENRNNQDPVRKILHFKEWPQEIFILTQHALYAVDLSSRINRKLYQSPDEKILLSFLPRKSDAWLLGTTSGLWISENHGDSWMPFSKFSSKPIPLLEKSEDFLFLAAGSELFISEDGQNFKRIFALTAPEEESPEEIPEEDPAEEDNPPTLLSPLTSLLISGQSQKIRLGTKNGIYESPDFGESWQKLPSSGLRDTLIRHLAAEDHLLFTSTSSGIYRFDAAYQRWVELYQGLSDASSAGIAAFKNSSGIRLAAITRDGLVQFPIADGILPQGTWIISSDKIFLFRSLIQKEPSALEIQQAVIRYANLKNGKIKRWHLESRLSALLPSLNFGKDFSSGNSIDLDRGGTNDPDVYIDGPQEKNKGWDVSVDWDFKDFIWSSSQTSIDSREKLMVDLRQDLLSEVTRIYFERRRLQMDLVFTPSDSERGHFEKLIRMDELTSLLDAMTDGFMQKRLFEIYAHHPEFNGLWEYFNREA